LQWNPKNNPNLGFFSRKVAVGVICAEIWINDIIVGVLGLDVMNNGGKMGAFP
jgi:hypothetical protein